MPSSDPGLDTTVTHAAGSGSPASLLSDAEVQRLGALNAEYYPQINQAKSEANSEEEKRQAEREARENVRQQVEDRLRAEGHPWADVWARAVAYDHILHDAKYRVMLDRFNWWVEEITKVRQFGRFTDIEPLGSGGFGVVFRAKDSERLGETGPIPVAIKLPHAPHKLSDRQTVRLPAREIAKFFLEARRHAGITVAGCVTLLDARMPEVVTVGGDPKADVDVDGILDWLRTSPIWFSMQLIQGRSLKDVLDPATYKPGDTLTVDQAISLMTRVADILKQLHATELPGGQGYIIHKDLKPGNILLDDQADPNPWLTDFGLATPRAGQSVFGNPSSGTPTYMAPEQWKDGDEVNYVNAQTDIWAWGVILYELLTGKPPFTGELAQLRAQILYADPDPPRRVNAEIPPYIEAIILRCLKRDRSERYGSFAEVLDALKSPTIPPDSADQIRDGLDRVETKVDRVQETLSTDRENEKQAVERLIKNGTVLLQQGNFAEAERHCTLAIDKSVALGDEELEFKSRLTLAYVSYEASPDVSGAGPAMHALRHFAERHAENGQVQCDTKLMLSQWLFRSGKVDEAEAMIREVLLLAESMKRPEAIGSAAHLMCWIARARRDLDLFRRHLTLYERSGGDAVDTAVLRADLAELEGDADTQVREIRAVLSNDLGPVAAVREYGLRLTLARLLCQLERTDEAEVATHASGRLQQRDPFSLELRLIAAQLEAQRADIQTAVRELTAVAALASDAAIPEIAAEAHLTRCRLLLDTGKLNDAYSAGGAAQAAFQASQGRDATGLVESIRLSAMALARMGKESRALALFEEALSVAVDRKTRKEQQWALRVQISHMLLSKGDLERARTTFPAADLLQSMPPATVKEYEQLQEALDTATTVRGRLLEIVTTNEPLRLAATDSARSINEAHQKVVCDLLKWTDDFPEMAAKAIDFWGRGSFARLLLNHRGFGVDHAFHVTAEVSTLDDARRAVRILAPICDCVTLLWKGPLTSQMAIFGVPLDYRGTGGWGYDICGGSEWKQEPGKRRLVPVVGVGNYLPDAVARFFVHELRPLVAAGRVLVLPAPLVGCVSSDHGPLERMFCEMMQAQPILQSADCDIAESISLIIPFFENAPFDDLAKIIDEEQESLLALRSALLRLATEHLRNGPVLTANASRAIREEIRSGVAQVEAKLRKLVRKLPDDVYTLKTTGLDSDAIASAIPGAMRGLSDDAARTLVAMADRIDTPAAPWYAVWRMRETFGQLWTIAGPILDNAGHPKGDEVDDAPPTGVYHWLHPPKLGAVQRRAIRVM